MPLLCVGILSVLTYTIVNTQPLTLVLEVTLPLVTCKDTYPVFRELRDVVQYQLVGVSQLVQVLLAGVRNHTAHDFGVGVFELGVTAEFLPFLAVLVLVCHIVIGSAFLSLF